MSADDALPHLQNLVKAQAAESYSSDEVSPNKTKTRRLRPISSSHEVPNVPSSTPNRKLQPVSSNKSPIKSESSLSQTINTVNKVRSQRKRLSYKQKHTMYEILPPIIEHVKEEDSDESVNPKDSELKGGPLFNYSYQRSEIIQTIDDEIMSLQKRVTLAEIAVRESSLLRTYGFKPQESSSLKNGEYLNTKQDSRDRISRSNSSTQSTGMMYSPIRKGPSRNLAGAKSKDCTMDLEGKDMNIGSAKNARTQVGRLVQRMRV